MKRWTSLILLVLFLSGCASMIPKEMSDVLAGPITDSFVVASVATFHQKEGRWPKDMIESGLNKQEGETNEEKNDIDFQNINFAENPDGSLTIVFGVSTNYLRKIVLEPPNLDNTQYLGRYKNVDDSTYQTSGMMTIDPTTEPMTVKFKGGIKNAGE